MEEDIDHPINIEILSKDEIIISQFMTIQFHKINKNKTNLLYSVNTNELIVSLLIKDNQLLVSTSRGHILIYKKGENKKFSEHKKISFPKNPIYFNLLDLKRNNLICGFTLDNFNIINLENDSIISNFVFNKKNNYKKKKLDKGDDELSNKNNGENEEDLENEEDEEEFDRNAKPFLIKSSTNKNDLIIFKQLFYLTIVDSKSLKIVKKIDLKKTYFSFQIYKPKEEESFFYMIIFNKKNKDNIEVYKYNSDLTTIDLFKATIKPHFEEEEIDSEYDVDYLDIYHDCLYRCIIKDVKNFSFVFKMNAGETSQITGYFLFNLKNGKNNKKSRELSIVDINCEEEIEEMLEIKQITEKKLIFAKGDYNDEIKEIKIINN